MLEYAKKKFPYIRPKFTFSFVFALKFYHHKQAQLNFVWWWLNKFLIGLD